MLFVVDCSTISRCISGDGGGAFSIAFSLLWSNVHSAGDPSLLVFVYCNS